MNFGKYALLALAGAGLLTFASCGKDEKKAAPVIKVMHGSDNVTGKTLKQADFPILAVATPADEVKEIGFEVTYKQEGQTGNQAYKKISAKKESLGYTGTINEKDLPSGIKEGTIIISAKGPDATGKLEVSFNFNADNGGGNGGGNETPAETWGEVKNGALNHKAGSAKGAYDLKNNIGVSITTGDKESMYMMNTSTGDKDFQASFTSDKVSITANGVKKDYMGNGCMYAKVSGVDFATVTVADARAKFTGASATMTDLKQNDILLAQKGNEFYILKITEVSKTSSRKSEGFMAFEYKLAKSSK